MKRPTFLHGVVAAALLAFVAGAVIATLAPLVGTGIVLRLVIAAMTLAYLLYLLRATNERIGKVTTVALWIGLATVTWWVSPPLPLYVLVHVGAIWLVRSLYFHAGVFPSLLDLGLSALGIAVAVWAASRTGSVFVATWSFFLVQALFVVIPKSIGRHTGSVEVADNRTFEQARRQADDALRQLLQR